jgi:hypothetical protein
MTRLEQNFNALLKKQNNPELTEAWVALKGEIMETINHLTDDVDDLIERD